MTNSNGTMPMASLEEINKAMDRMARAADAAMFNMLLYGVLPATARRVDAMFENLPEAPPDEA